MSIEESLNAIEREITKIKEDIGDYFRRTTYVHENDKKTIQKYIEKCFEATNTIRKNVRMLQEYKEMRNI